MTKEESKNSEQIFYKGTKFLLNDGRIKNVEDLSADDELMGYNGCGRAIDRILCQEKIRRKTTVISTNESFHKFDKNNLLILSSNSDTIINLISMLKNDLKSVEVYDFFYCYI